MDLPVTLTKLIVHNICQHEHVEIDLGEGLFAIVGPNGSGKSNLLRSLMYGLTGQVDGLWGSQKSLQKDGSVTPGYVEVHFRTSESEHVLRRYAVSSGKTQDYLTLGDDKVVDRRKNVDAHLEQIFGVSCSLLFRVAWARQGELAQLLTAPPASISAFLAQLYDMRFIETIRERIKDQTDHVLRYDGAAQARADSEQSQLESIPSEEDLLQTVDSAQAEVDKAKDALLAAEKAFPNEAEVNRMHEELRSCTAKLSGLPTAVEPDATKDIDDLAGTLAVASDMLTKTYNARSDALYRADTQRRHLQELDRHKRLIQTRLDEYRSKIEFGKYMADGMREHCQCPVCEGCLEKPDMKDHVARLNKILGISVEIASAEKLTVELSDTEELIAAAVKRKDIEDSKAEAAVMQYNLAQASVQDIKNAITARERTRLGARIEELKNALSLTSSQEEVVRAARLNLRQAEMQHAQAVAAHSQAVTKRSMLQSSIELLKKQHEQGETNEAVRATLIELRDILSPQRAQALFMAARIKALNASLAYFMTMTQMPFSLRLDEQTRSFVVTTQDGFDHPSVHLSGAQRSMASVALQMALMQILPMNLSLYLIDEPTEALDVGNKRIMGEMFQKMRSIIPAVKGTMLIVTRDQEVTDACSQTIDIGEM